MKAKTSLQQLLSNGETLFLPSLSVDCVIFGFHDNQLKVLLLKMKKIDTWSLPGGFVFKDEHIDTAAARVLKERTGIDKLFLQQFYIFGEPNRSDQSIHRRMMEGDEIIPADAHWILRRFVTIGYYALVEFNNVQPLPDALSDSCAWWHLSELPPLMMDHAMILNKALESLRLHLQFHPVGYNLLPARFTMPQLQKLYETILDKKLDRRNFQRKMLSYQILKRKKATKKGVAYKAPYLYSFDLRKYHNALKNGLKDSW